MIFTFSLYAIRYNPPSQSFGPDATERCIRISLERPCKDPVWQL